MGRANAVGQLLPAEAGREGTPADGGDRHGSRAGQRERAWRSWCGLVAVVLGVFARRTLCAVPLGQDAESELRTCT
ncbi:hypothetical protein [Haloactinomyces albus]|uniref:Uncharacterized protein n=1 Tax=Haloactinomyces albus TaxID=1352928 RepID=A0AAE4CK90_9ACTN|nr:hypothetical protein [Haloactinomyces albus]MDR7300086.1 hypothetical protein [Haloactinomyces albus]